MCVCVWLVPHADKLCLILLQKRSESPQQTEAAAAADSSSSPSTQQAETKAETEAEAKADPAAAPRQDQGAEQETAEARDGDDSPVEIIDTEDSSVAALVLTDFADSVHELFKWVSVKDPQHAMMYANYEAILGRPACAVK